MAVIDVAGYVAELKEHAVDHGFHVHDERHFVETYSLRQAWEVDLHPEEGCGGPLDLHLSLEVDPRVLLAFEDIVVDLPDEEDPPEEFHFPLVFTWALPPLPAGPDLLLLATELAGVGGPDLPLEVSAIDSFGSVTGTCCAMPREAERRPARWSGGMLNPHSRARNVVCSIVRRISSQTVMPSSSFVFGRTITNSSPP